jgi:hypothetical protein
MVKLPSSKCPLDIIPEVRDYNQIMSWTQENDVFLLVILDVCLVFADVVF